MEMEPKVKEILNKYLNSGIRLRIFFGSDGKIWDEEYETMGYIGITLGTQKELLLLNNTKSLGGMIISYHAVAVKVTGRNEFLYFNPDYKLPEYSVLPCEELEFYERGYKYSLYLNGNLCNHYETERKAVGFGRFMAGLSDAKNSVGPLSGRHPKYS